MRKLKVFRGALGLLGQKHQVLLLVEDSGSEGITADDPILNGFDRVKILKILQELQWPGFVLASNGEIPGQRWYSLRGWCNG